MTSESERAAEPDRRDFLRLAASGLALTVLAAAPRMAAAQAAGGPLKIGMIGSGREGGALGSLFVKAGHPVMFSSRNPERLKDFVTGLGSLAQAGTVEQAIGFGDVVALVVPYTAVEEIGKAHASALATKVLVLDVSNQQTSPVLWAASSIDITNDIVKLYDQANPADGSAAKSPAPPVASSDRAERCSRSKECSSRTGPECRCTQS